MEQLQQATPRPHLAGLQEMRLQLRAQQRDAYELMA